MTRTEVRPERLRRRSATAASHWDRCRCAPLAHANRQRPTTLRVVVDLPTFWFVGRLGFCRLYQINKLDGPPSLYVPPSLAKSRRVRVQPYAAALPARLLSTRTSLSCPRKAATQKAGLRRTVAGDGNGTHGGAPEVAGSLPGQTATPIPLTALFCPSPQSASASSRG